MSKSDDRQFCVLDHANKQADRQRVNPIRVNGRRAKSRSGKMMDSAFAGGDPESKSRDKTG
jgi:hypothetical protein